MWYPAAQPLRLPWFGYPSGAEGGNDVRAVVHHIASGWWSTLIDPAFWQTRNGGSGGSVHFAVSLAGEVVQFVDTADAAYGNGIVLNPSWPLVSLGNPNEHTVSIEHEGLTGEPWSQPMYAASLALTRWILKAYGLTAGPDTLIGHYRIDSVNRAQCPGSSWPIARYLTDLLEVDMTPDEVRAIARHEAIAVVGYDPASREGLSYNAAHAADGHTDVAQWARWGEQPLLMARVKRFFARLVSKNPQDHPGIWPAD